MHSPAAFTVFVPVSIREQIKIQTLWIVCRYYWEMVLVCKPHVVSEVHIIASHPALNAIGKLA